MSEQDAEIELLKGSVSCAALLERLPPVWRLDRAESSRRSLKYRRSDGEIVIVNHDGRGWWDPLSEAKGDIFTLVRHLEPGLSFTDARLVLRGFVGMAPAFPEIRRARETLAPDIPVAERWRGASICRSVRRLGSISPNGAACRRPFSSPHAPPMRSGRGRAAAPGSHTTTARHN
jgi:hypothetical protein